jgi:hypothetical protein
MTKTTLIRDGLGLMAVAATAVLGYSLLRPPAASADRLTARELTAHTKGCAMCRLPLYGGPETASQHGPDAIAVASADPMR